LPPTEAESAAPRRVGVSSAWLKKSLKRAEEQALEDKIPLEEIAEKRWGVRRSFTRCIDGLKGSLGDLSNQHKRPIV